MIPGQEQVCSGGWGGVTKTDSSRIHPHQWFTTCGPRPLCHWTMLFTCVLSRSDCMLKDDKHEASWLATGRVSTEESRDSWWINRWSLLHQSNSMFNPQSLIINKIKISLRTHCMCCCYGGCGLPIFFRLWAQQSTTGSKKASTAGSLRVQSDNHLCLGKTAISWSCICPQSLLCVFPT